MHVTQQFFEAIGPQGHFFEKNKETIFRYGLGQYVY